VKKIHFSYFSFFSKGLRYLVFLVIIIVMIGVVSCSHINTQYQVDTNTLNTKQEIPWGIVKTNIRSLSANTTGNGIKVAILDSGIDFTHPDFGDNIKEGFNFLNPTQLPCDDFGHGTLVSGIIVAQDNNNGIIGVAPKVELYPLKVLDNHGEGDISNIVKAIDWCIANKIQIINMSFSTIHDNILLHSHIKKASKAGLIIVAASGESDGGDVGYPASYNEVISVTAVDKNLEKPISLVKGKIDFSAPGYDILTTTNSGGYVQSYGTSLAASYVTGIIALIIQNPQEFNIPINSTCSYAILYKKLEEYSLDIGEKGLDKLYGNGFIILKDFGYHMKDIT
jgi:subtilisin family serine protease